MRLRRRDFNSSTMSAFVSTFLISTTLLGATGTETADAQQTRLDRAEAELAKGTRAGNKRAGMKQAGPELPESVQPEAQQAGATQAGVERSEDQAFHELWQSRLPDQSESPMIDLLEAVSSKKSGAQTRNLLKGVVKITRTNDSVQFDRRDGAALIWHKDTGDGARFFSDWEESAIKIQKQVGESGANYLRSLRSIEVKGDQIEVLADEGKCSIPFQREQKGFLKLKALHLSKLSLTLKKENDVIWIKRLNGVEALLSAGIAEVPIQLREFCRRKNEKGDTVLTFGLSTPFLSPLRALLIVPDAFRISFVVKKGSTPPS